MTEARAGEGGAGQVDDTGLVHTTLERLGIHYNGGDYANEAAAARAAYFAVTGELNEEDHELFEPRMIAFLEWYVLERPIAGSSVTPVAKYLAEREPDLSLPERDVLARLRSTRRSLFLVGKVGKTEVTLEDLLAGGQLRARERRGTIGFTAGDVCEARLCASDGGHIFTKTLLFHPRAAVKVIRKAIKEARKAGADLGDFPFRLTRIYQRWVRQGHVAADKIYREGLTRRD